MGHRSSKTGSNTISPEDSAFLLDYLLKTHRFKIHTGGRTLDFITKAQKRIIEQNLMETFRIRPTSAELYCNLMDGQYSDPQEFANGFLRVCRGKRPREAPTKGSHLRLVYTAKSDEVSVDAEDDGSSEGKK